MGFAKSALGYLSSYKMHPRAQTSAGGPLARVKMFSGALFSRGMRENSLGACLAKKALSKSMMQSLVDK
jgi:hypothetical protein